MSVDFPQPFGPRTQTCSPEAISRFTSRSAAWSPRITVTFLSRRSGGATLLLHGEALMRDVTPKSRSGHLNREKGEAQRAKGDEDGTKAEDRESPLRRGANKKEVKQPQFHLPGWVGCCMSKHSGGSAGLPCQAGLRPHSRVAFGNSIGDSPPKSFSFSGL